MNDMSALSSALSCHQNVVLLTSYLLCPAVLVVVEQTAPRIPFNSVALKWQPTATPMAGGSYLTRSSPRKRFSAMETASTWSSLPYGGSRPSAPTAASR